MSTTTVLILCMALFSVGLCGPPRAPNENMKTAETIYRVAPSAALWESYPAYMPSYGYRSSVLPYYTGMNINGWGYHI